MPWNYASFYGPSVNFGTSDWAGGRFLTQYTYQFGNGVSGTLSIEESKPYIAQGGDRPIFNGGAALTSTPATIDANNAALGFGLVNAATLGAPGASQQQSFVAATSLAAAVGSLGYNSGGGQRAPDIVGQLRVDQSWGTFQIAAAAHMNHALYYGALEFSGHPEDKWGGAVTAGIKLNLPWGTGDFVALGGAYARRVGLHLQPRWWSDYDTCDAAVRLLACGYLREPGLRLLVRCRLREWHRHAPDDHLRRQHRVLAQLEPAVGLQLERRLRPLALRRRGKRHPLQRADGWCWCPWHGHDSCKAASVVFATWTTRSGPSVLGPYGPRSRTS